MHRWCLLNLTVQGFSLNLTVGGGGGGVSNKHCLLTFFHCIYFFIFYSAAGKLSRAISRNIILIALEQTSI